MMTHDNPISMAVKGRLQAPLWIAGKWSNGTDSGSVINPATGELLGYYAVADDTAVLTAAEAAKTGFKVWRNMSATDRGRILVRAGAILRDRCDTIAEILTAENGKPLVQAVAEILISADYLEWYGQEATRICGRLLPDSHSGSERRVQHEPVGVVAAFTPWNFPVSQSARKLGAALAAGCAVILKGAEETPFSCVALVQALLDAGLPAETLQLLFGQPSMISDILIAHPTIRKISFTGSVPVGRLLAADAGQSLTASTLELGGHAPVLVFADALLEEATDALVSSKYRNAGQVCVSPTRICVESGVMATFVSLFKEKILALRVGSGMDNKTDMGPLIHARQCNRMQELVDDAIDKGAELLCGGHIIHREGYFFEPTLLIHVPNTARIMNEEPFGPIAIINEFQCEDDALAEANRLPYGLAAYLYTQSYSRIKRLTENIETGMISVNGQTLTYPDSPFGGIKDSGFGREGGIEGLNDYLVTKFISLHIQ